MCVDLSKSISGDPNEGIAHHRMKTSAVPGLRWSLVGGRWSFVASAGVHCSTATAGHCTRSSACSSSVSAWRLRRSGQQPDPHEPVCYAPRCALLPRAERFDPERWTPEARASRPRFSYFPFGGGPRQCIGEGFAWMEGILLLATLARRGGCATCPAILSSSGRLSRCGHAMDSD